MRDAGQSQEEDALRVPVTIVSVAMLAIGLVLLSALAYAVIADLRVHILLRYALPIAAVAVIGVTFHIRRRLGALEAALRQLRESEADARFLAMHHAVSRLPNRRHFVQALRDRMTAAPRTCLVLVRLDSFSTFIESGGRRTADALAAQIGSRLLSSLQPGDLIGQLANDLFAIARTLPSGDDGGVMREQALAALVLPFDLAGKPVALFASAGMTISEGRTDPEQLLAEAEEDLSRTSADWRNRDRRRNAG